MSVMASQITGVSIACSTVCPGANQTKKLRVVGLCEGNSPVTGGFHSQRDSKAENVSIWRRRHGDIWPQPNIIENDVSKLLNLVGCLEVHDLEVRKQRYRMTTHVEWITPHPIRLSPCAFPNYHNDVIKMSATASQITSLTSVYATVYSGADQRKHQSSASLAFVRGIQR